MAPCHLYIQAQPTKKWAYTKMGWVSAIAAVRWRTRQVDMIMSSCISLTPRYFESVTSSV